MLIENFTILRDARPRTTPIISTDEKNYLQTLISTYGLMIFQFDIHPVLLTIQVDMKDDSKSNRVIVLGFISIQFAIGAENCIFNPDLMHIFLVNSLKFYSHTFDGYFNNIIGRQ